MYELTSFSTDEQLVVTCFEVSYLFTNIPLEETIDFWTDLVFNTKNKLNIRIVLLTARSLGNN